MWRENKNEGKIVKKRYVHKRSLFYFFISCYVSNVCDADGAMPMFWTTCVIWMVCWLRVVCVCLCVHMVVYMCVRVVQLDTTLPTEHATNRYLSKCFPCVSHIAIFTDVGWLGSVRGSMGELDVCVCLRLPCIINWVWWKWIANIWICRTHRPIWDKWYIQIRVLHMVFIYFFLQMFSMCSA